MNRRAGTWAATLLLGALLLPPGSAGAQDGAGGGVGAPPPDLPPPLDLPPPPATDLRFFPKDLEDALKELGSSESDEDSRYEALLKITRMRGLDGAADPLKKDAWVPVMEKALGTREDTFADTAGTFLAALDAERLASEVRKAAGSEREAWRLRNLTFLAENLGAPKGVEILVGSLAGSSTAAAVRVRVVEALGLLRAPQGLPLASAAMHDAEFEVRNIAAMALGRIGDPKAAPLLLAGLGENKGFHSWYCAEALGMIEDPGIFDAVLARSAGGSSAGPRAKALENCARPGHLEALLGLVQRAPDREIRTAAANALGRLVGEDGGAADALQPEVREAVADALLEGMVSDRDPPVRAACCWALRACATPLTGAKAFRRLTTVQGDDKILFLLTLLGERKVREAAETIFRAGILAAKEPMIRRASGVSFWQIGDPGQVKAFREQALAASDYSAIQRYCEALGSWKSKEGFDLALQMLRSTRDGSREQFEVLLALEKMTGHFFGPFPGTWNKWFEKNPDFFNRKQEHIEREKWRAEFDKENKGGYRQTKETEKSVQLGLLWLARHQGLDGIWDPAEFHLRCDEKDPCSRQGGNRVAFAPAGMTGLPCLAFLGAGYGPMAGKYRHSVLRGLESLVATLSPDGDYQQEDWIRNRSYVRPVALQALAEGYASSGDVRFRRAAERIVAREFALMNIRGGWRYQLGRESGDLDSSVVAWVVFALKAAEKAGIPVPRLLWEGPYLAFDHLSQRVPATQEYFEEFVQDAGDYGFEVGKDKTYVFITGYQDATGGPGRATTPLGVMSRIFLGWRRTHPFCIGGANYIVKTYQREFDVFGEPGKEDWSRAGRFAPQGLWPMYNYYYCTLAMHQMGGKYFYNWNRRVSRALPIFQKKEGCARGSWPSAWNQDTVQGWIYTTCMGVLTLETYYRYAPILQD